MPTTVTKIDDQGRLTLQDMCVATYLHGRCYAFATALHLGLGWPIVGLMNGTEIEHAVVRAPDGTFFDARGFISEEQVARPFRVAHPIMMREVVVDDLRREGEPPELRAASVGQARRMAEAIWPELPWKESALQRAIDFCAELEALCRAHGFWIRAPYATTRPILEQIDCNGISGYSLEPNLTASAFTISAEYK